MRIAQHSQLPAEQASGPDPFYLRYRIATPADSFYTDLNQKLSSMIGFESEIHDYHSALSTLNTVLNMGLDDLDLAVFRLLLTSLDQANRFGGDLHICPVRGENSAVHALRTLTLDTEVARRAGNLSQESQSEPGVIQQRIRRLRCLLSHDMGEIPGEQSTLASRAHDPSLMEMPEIEREIFRVLLTEAYRSAHSFDFPAFYGFQGEIRRAVGDPTNQANAVRVLMQHVQEYDASSRFSALPPYIQGRIHEWLYDFDTIELKNGSDRTRLFIGYSSKIVENLQGTRHLLRLGTFHPEDTRLKVAFPHSHPNAPQDPKCKSDLESRIPLRLASNVRLIKNFTYLEPNLAGLFEHASTEHELRHARALRDLVYLTLAEWLSLGRPIFDRRILQRAPEEQKDPQELIDIQSRIKAATNPADRASHIKAARGCLETLLHQDYQEAKRLRHTIGDAVPQDRLLDIETRGRMIALYLYAVHQDFIPTSRTPLLLQERLPEQLHGFTALTKSNTYGQSPFATMSFNSSRSELSL